MKGRMVQQQSGPEFPFAQDMHMNEIAEWLPVAIKSAVANLTSGYQGYSLFD